jgi:hypothetical protein
MARKNDYLKFPYSRVVNWDKRFSMASTKVFVVLVQLLIDHDMDSRDEVVLITSDEESAKTLARAKYAEYLANPPSYVRQFCGAMVVEVPFGKEIDEGICNEKLIMWLRPSRSDTATSA